MKTLLILTDFSQAATHAAKYATFFAKQLGIDRIILFNKLQSITSIATTPLISDKASQAKEEAVINLKNLVNELKFLKQTNTELFFLAKEGSLDDLTNEMISKYQVDFIVMGLTGKSKLEQTLIGSNTIQLSKTISKPLLIIPETTKLTPITKVAVFVDPQDLRQVNAIKLLNTLFLHHTELHILSHENDHTPIKSLHNHNRSSIREKLALYKPTYHNMNGIDIVEEILDFVNTHDISLIIHIEKKRNLFENLFLTDITERMAYVTKIPLLLIKQT
ncbi:universal stress protein [Olivibacter sp. SDN3]|uniref:universal stress protein n=1 Tax=Olivibacter sp. SDN3 TaxID=2764720 RepID=UPI001650EF4B|nr:universal stress protein [Olivibacter sp. SDN3]QNL48617.1 universal stress protein [Olivibacter sp. SDN3]